MMRKSKKRKPDMRRIRPTKTYSIPEIADALDRRPETVRRWLANGLPRLDDARPVLVFGGDLKSWLTARWASRKKSCQLDEMYCLKCREPRKPVTGSVLVQRSNRNSSTFAARCRHCGTNMMKAVSHRLVVEFCSSLGASQPDMQHLKGYAIPALKRTDSSDSFPDPIFPSKQTEERTCDVETQRPQRTH